MSYDIDLNDPVTGKTIQLDEKHHMRGGTYAMGGTTDASLNVTYNYGAHLYRVFPVRPFHNDQEWERYGRPDSTGQGGIRSIYGTTGAESIPILQAAIDQLGNDVDPDYWEPSEGNVKRALVQLKTLATMRPDGVWAGD